MGATRGKSYPEAVLASVEDRGLRARPRDRRLPLEVEPEEAVIGQEPDSLGVPFSRERASARARAYFAPVEPGVTAGEGSAGDAGVTVVATTPGIFGST
jgi:hypothetical protein